MRPIQTRASRMALAALATLVAMVLTGCDPKPEEKPAATKPVVGILVYRQDDTYISLVTQAIKDGLEGKAVAEVLYAEGDQMAQNEQLEALIAKKASAVALNIVDPQAASRAVDAVKKAGIPVIFFNREPDLNTLRAYAKARFVGTNAFDAGMMQGDIIRELWERHPEYDRNGDGKFQYVMIQANLDNPEAIARTEYSVRQARQNGILMQQVGETLLCNWDEGLARESMQLLFPLHEDSVELVIANNDSMALGAIAALNGRGYNLKGGDGSKFIPVVGVDAVPKAVAAIREGVMSATVVQDGGAMGKSIASMVLNAIGGKDFLEGLPYGWDDSGIAVRIPYSRFGN